MDLFQMKIIRITKYTMMILLIMYLLVNASCSRVPKPPPASLPCAVTLTNYLGSCYTSTTSNTYIGATLVVEIWWWDVTNSRYAKFYSDRQTVNSSSTLQPVTFNVNVPGGAPSFDIIAYAEGTQCSPCAWGHGGTPNQLGACTQTGAPGGGYYGAKPVLRQGFSTSYRAAVTVSGFYHINNVNNSCDGSCIVY